MSLQILQAKVADRRNVIARLISMIGREREQLTLLTTAKVDLEYEMIERSGTPRGHARWTAWSTLRHEGITFQVNYVEASIVRLEGKLTGHAQAVVSLERQIAVIERRLAPEINSTIKATIAAIDGPKIEKGKKRRYVPKGEKTKKSVETPKPAKKDKNQKRGRKAA